MRDNYRIQSEFRRRTSRTAAAKQRPSPAPSTRCDSAMGLGQLYRDRVFFPNLTHGLNAVAGFQMHLHPTAAAAAAWSYFTRNPRGARRWTHDTAHRASNDLELGCPREAPRSCWVSFWDPSDLNLMHKEEPCVRWCACPCTW
mmetsp:Transcript_36789/g.97963  ORF Transcript_36789/g.97963 Transcript_36789/m.97963 type:complete len:143 (-) Transcript_36789:2588-3016(-)